eukprot:7385202-Prymnesium_polylepis.2
MASRAGHTSRRSCSAGMASSAASAGATTCGHRCAARRRPKGPPLLLCHPAAARAHPAARTTGRCAVSFATGGCAPLVQLNKGDWTPEEDVEIWDRVQQMGTKWAQISELYMPSRTDNDIKNRWNSIIRKTQHPG